LEGYRVGWSSESEKGPHQIKRRLMEIDEEKEGY
jgi:hypothetical protein